MDKIVHLITDDKFAKYAYSSFSESKELSNEFIVLSESQDLKYVEFKCRIYSPSQLNNVIKIINKSRVFIIHFMNEFAQRILSLINQDVVVIWIGWGGDYYWLIDTLPNFSIYGPKTKKLAKYYNHPFAKLIKKYTRRNKYKIIKRVNYFSPVLQDEIDLVKVNYPDFSAQYIPWNYGNLEDHYVKNLQQFVIEGNDFMIGNSATMTNNHLDIFEYFKNIDLNEKKLFIPLSYGNKEYGNFISKYASEMFGYKAVILTDFLEHDDYIRMLLSCGNIVMGHMRQQAMGNIITFLFLGAKIFFFKESIVYKYLKKAGFVIFRMEDLQNRKITEQVLPKEVVAKHRLLLSQVWGKNTNDLNTKKIFELCR